MEISQFIGFIIAVLFMLFVSITNGLKERNRRKKPVQPAGVPLPPPIKVKREKRQGRYQEKPKEKVVQHKVGSAYEDKYVDNYVKYVDNYVDNYVEAKTDTKRAPAYNVLNKATPSTANKLLVDLKSPKNMLIYHEIFGPPKGL